MANASDQKILDLLRTGRAATQAELCRLTGSRSSTMTCVLKRLRRRGLVTAAGTRAGGRGRPPAVLRFQPRGRLLALDIDGTRMHLGLMDLAGAVVRRTTLEMPNRPQPRDVLRRCVRAARRLTSAAGAQWKQLRALGLSVNGWLSSDGVLAFSTVLPWRDVPFGAMAGELFALPVVCSDGHYRAVVEHRRGAGRGSRVMLHFNVADGVSARPVVDGELYAGSRTRSGEIGHVVLQPNGPACGCGQRGCLQALISGPAICRRIVHSARSGRSVVPDGLVGLARAGQAARTVTELVRLAEREDVAFAKRILRETVELAGRGLAMATACFDPDTIVVDGYVFRDRPRLIEGLEEVCRRHSSPAAMPLPTFRPAALGAEARLLSLAILVGDNLAREEKLTGS